MKIFNFLFSSTKQLDELEKLLARYKHALQWTQFDFDGVQRRMEWYAKESKKKTLQLRKHRRLLRKIMKTLPESAFENHQTLLSEIEIMSEASKDK